MINDLENKIKDFDKHGYYTAAALKPKMKITKEKLDKLGWQMNYNFKEDYMFSKNKYRIVLQKTNKDKYKLVGYFVTNDRK